MSNLIKKPSLSEKRKSQPWDMKKVIEFYSGKPYEQVLREYKEKKKQ